MNILPFIVVGITSGSIYALAATGLVLTYKTSGIFNFAHGAVAAAAAYAFFELHSHAGLPWPLAAALCVLVFGPLAGLGIELLARGLATATPTAKLVATIGLLLGIEGIAVVLYGSAAKDFPQFLPTATFKVAGVFVGVDQLIVVLVALLGVAGLFAFFRFTRIGVAMQGVVDSADLLGLTGTNPTRVRRIAWMIGCSFAAVSGLLIAPSIGLDPLLLTLLVVQAYGAAAIGRFSSLPMTYVGGLAVGVGAALATRFTSNYLSLQGLPSSVPFLILFGVLLFRGRLLTEVGSQATKRIVTAARFTAGQRRLGIGAALAIAALIPGVVGTKIPVYTSALAFVVIFASLGLLVRTSGQLSLCHIGFAAVGAAAFAHLAQDHGVPWMLAILAAGLVAVPVGALVAIPAIRLSGLYLALASFGFGILLERLGYSRDVMFGINGALTAPRPSIAGGDTAYYYVVLAVLAACVASMVIIERSRLGRLLRALADSPLALSTAGTSVNVTRVLVFCLSAFFAGVGGALIGPVTGSINGTSFPSFASLILVAVLVIAGSGLIRSAVLAAAAFIVVPSYIENATFQEGLPAIFGLAAMLTAVASAGGFDAAGRLARWAQATAWRTRRSPVTERLRGLVPEEMLPKPADALLAEGAQT
ncbi:MAG TPA: ABC transporter permease [Candidatus Dormibacteraeota bacterium]|nr:ABC transporter permease [Candidatus Dormibacteraeota bacterium]